MIMALKPRNVLEVGTHIGASTLYIARALRRLNLNGRMTSVDIVDVNDPERGAWKQLGLPKSPQDFASHLECLDLIDFRTGSCLDFMHTTRLRYDFVFLMAITRRGPFIRRLVQRYPSRDRRRCFTP